MRERSPWFKLLEDALRLLLQALQRREQPPAPRSSRPSPRPPATLPDLPTARPAPSTGATGIARAFAQRLSDAWVEDRGRVVKLLPDDNDSHVDGTDRHQRFLVEVRGGVTVLIAHNIDAAQRIPVREGDTLSFRGEYEWTEKGGTLHFTHRPRTPTRNPECGGWIEHAGTRYQ